jgi:ABC-type nitrate/sulfonate/bicarbonate transport system permease component
MPRGIRFGAVEEWAVGWRRVALGAVAVVAPLLLWELVSRTLLNQRLVPPPTVVLAAAWTMVKDGDYFINIAVSLKRVLIGFALGSTIGILLGAAMVRIRFVEELLRLPLAVCSSVPPLAMVPLVMVWFGLDEAGRIFLITYLAAVLMTSTTLGAMRNTALIRTRAAEALGARGSRMFFRVMLPDAFPVILNGLRVTLGFCFMVVVAAEMFGASSGIGYIIIKSRFWVLTDRMLVGILSLGMLGWMVDALFGRLVSWSLPRFASEKRVS